MAEGGVVTSFTLNPHDSSRFASNIHSQCVAVMRLPHLYLFSHSILRGTVAGFGDEIAVLQGVEGGSQ